jgi:hypothetical protein
MVIGVLIDFAYGRPRSVLARHEACDFGVKTCAERWKSRPNRVAGLGYLACFTNDALVSRQPTKSTI